MLLPAASPAAGYGSHGSPSTVTWLQPALPAGQTPVPAAIVHVADSAPDTIVDVYGPSASCGGLFGEKYFPAIHSVSVLPAMNLVWATHHRAGAVAHVVAAATTHPAAPPPTHPAAVSTLSGSNTTVQPSVSCTLRPHPRISLTPCRALHQGEPTHFAGANRQKNTVKLSVDVNDIEHFIKKLANLGATFHYGPRLEYGFHLAEFEDTEGNCVRLYEKVHKT